MVPHEREAVWRLTPNSAIYVVQDAVRAGSALVTIALDNLSVHERRLRDNGSRSPRRSAELLLGGSWSEMRTDTHSRSSMTPRRAGACDSRGLTRVRPVSAMSPLCDVALRMVAFFSRGRWYGVMVS